jgi:hypothetical protein
MPTQACLDAIKKKEPPIYCDTLEANYCLDIQQEINIYCEHNGLGGDTPVIQKFSKTQKCYCCCSCFAWGTPIAVAPGQFKLIEDFREGDEVLTTGPKVGKWVPRKVTMATGLARGFTVSFMFYCAFILDDSHQPRYIITTADHLFLLPDGTLKAIQDLRPRDKVRTADGGTATVVFATPGSYSNGVRHIAIGDWSKGQPLDGHLINSNDLVTADLAVQAAYYGGLLPAKLLAADSERGAERASIGSRRYFEKYASVEMTEFLADKKLWPAGFIPAMQPLINVPVSASAFFTQAQAEDIAANTVADAYANGSDLAMMRYLVTVYTAFAPDLKFIIDWTNELPNAYYFELEQQKFAVVTGGLARISSLSRDGMAMIMAHLIANSRDSKCVGPADYYGVFYYLRSIWNDELFIQVYDIGLAQIEGLFQAISPENRKADPNDICAQPSTDCRVQTYEAAAAFKKLPSCGVPPPAFVLSSVTAESLKKVAVAFNRDVDPPSGQTAKNYGITPGVKVTAAAVDGADPKTVRLTVKGMKADTEYLLTVQNVTDAIGQIISPDGNHLTFSTKGLT